MLHSPVAASHAFISVGQLSKIRYRKTKLHATRVTTALLRYANRVCEIGRQNEKSSLDQCKGKVEQVISTSKQ